MTVEAPVEAPAFNRISNTFFVEKGLEGLPTLAVWCSQQLRLTGLEGISIDPYRCGADCWIYQANPQTGYLAVVEARKGEEPGNRPGGLPANLLTEATITRNITTRLLAALLKYPTSADLDQVIQQILKDSIPDPRGMATGLALVVDKRDSPVLDILATGQIKIATPHEKEADRYETLYDGTENPSSGLTIARKSIPRDEVVGIIIATPGIEEPWSGTDGPKLSANYQKGVCVCLKS